MTRKWDIQEGSCSQEPKKKIDIRRLEDQVPDTCEEGVEENKQEGRSPSTRSSHDCCSPRPQKWSSGNKENKEEKSSGILRIPALFSSIPPMPNQVVRSRSPSFPRYRDRFKTKTIGWLKTSEKDKENNRNNCPLQGYYFAHISSHRPPSQAQIRVT